MGCTRKIGPTKPTVKHEEFLKNMTPKLDYRTQRVGRTYLLERISNIKQICLLNVVRLIKTNEILTIAIYEVRKQKGGYCHLYLTI